MNKLVSVPLVVAAALGLAACTKQAPVGDNVVGNDTVLFNEEGSLDANLTDDAPALGNADDALTDDAVDPGNVAIAN